jgi:murein DD-endopeptidase MepM/ murein hydrolase activator NlpD
MKIVVDLFKRKENESEPKPAKGEYIYPFKHPNPESVPINIHPPEGTHTGVFDGAIDFMLELGTPVIASDSGIVVAPYHRGSTIWGDKLEFAAEANLVTIFHPRHSEFTQYIHLGPDVTVKPGDTVERGQELGKTALSGYMGGEHPEHLHFFVFKAQSNKEGFIGLKPKMRKP